MPMCCFSGQVDHVGQTRIFARSGDDGRQFLVYQMTYHAAAEVAMVLPLPTPVGSAEDAVFFIDLSAYAELFADLRRAFPEPMTKSDDRAATAVAPAATPLAVVKVGSFIASFVPSRADFARVDARFRLPEATFTAFPRYDDHGFAVFQLRPDAATIHPMAFEFPRRDPSALFFPTVHVHDGTAPAQAVFDHDLYCQPAGDERFALAAWTESPQPAGATVRCDLAGGVVAPNQHLYRRSLAGPLPNRDTVVGPA
jgi:hypothetical protein